NLTTSFHEYRSTLSLNESVSFEDYFHATFPLSNTTLPAVRGFNITSPVPSPSVQGLTDSILTATDGAWTVSPGQNSYNSAISGNVTDEILGVDRTTAEIVVISIVVGLLAILTAGGNMLVIVAFKLDKNLQTVSNYFLLSLAVADLTIGIVSMPLYTVYLLMGYWPLKALMCDIWLSLDYTMSNASVANLIIISFDRYLSVTRPLTYRAKRTPRRAATMIGCAWVISSLIWTPWIFAWPYIEGKRTVPSNDCYIQFLKTNHYITVITAMFAFYIPVIIMSVLYFRIYMETQKRQKDLPKLQGMHNTSERGNNLVNQNCNDLSETPTVKSKLLGCLKIDRDSDYLEDSSSSEPPGSPPTSNAHSNSTLPALCTPRSNGEKARSKVQSRRQERRQDQKAAKTLTAILLAFIVTWTPYNIFAVVQVFCGGCINGTLYAIGKMASS
ncbi:unnamed protein product, partial [Lymnaea stagnalis]